MPFPDIREPGPPETERTGAAEATDPGFLSACKSDLQSGRERLREQYLRGKPVDELVRRSARLIDRLLIRIWKRNVTAPALTLVAVGGYGRGELLPGSDIDLMILIPPRADRDINGQAERFLAFLWDTGMEVGHSVRTVRDCARLAKSDITIATNLMEARLLAGDRPQFQAMRDATGPAKLWPARKFFEAKMREQEARHDKFEETEHRVEPNVKEGPGGLRDIQVIAWVANRQFGTSGLSALVRHGFLTEQEFQSLDRSRTFLWRVRFALHTITGRGEDRLLFEHQKAVARIFGYESDDNSGVERFMRAYYQTALEVSRLNEMLLQHFREVIVYARRRTRIKPLNRRFQINNDFIEARGKNTFKRYPVALLEMFLLIQQNPRIKGVRASTIRLVRESLPLIDDRYRDDIRNKSLFMEIIRQPRLVGHELRRMHRYGVLGAYLPEFAAVEGRMQFDLFHVYTVDEHILFVVRNMRLFGLDEYASKYPRCRGILARIPKQELLYLAGIFHDIAKGRGGDHSELGAEDALRFCHAHHLPEFDCRLVAWLVRHHLLMSKTAQREDINDPDTINRFAAEVGDIMHLNYIYLLTVADISGTNPKLWNSWKNALLAELYDKTLLALRRGLENPIDKEDRIQEVKQAALVLLSDELRSGRAEQVWNSLGDDYFIRYSPDEIAWHTRAIIKVTEARLPLVLLREMTDRGGSEVFIYMHDHDNIFSRMTRALDRLGLNIVDARIITSASGFTLDTFIVLEANGKPLAGRERKREVREQLHDALTSLDKPLRKTSRIPPRALRTFPVHTDVLFSQDRRNGRTVMELVTLDRPGLLCEVGTALEFCGARLQGAKIATYGERVEDIFFITDHDNRMIEDKAVLDSLRRSITESLAQS